MALPAHVADMLGVATEAEPPPAPASEEQPRRSTPTLSAPAAAVAVMAILGFGVIVGSVVSPPAQSAPAAVIAVRQPQPAPAPVKPRAASAAPAPAPAAPAAPVQQTVTQTVPAPARAAPAPEPVTPTGPQLPDIKHVFLVVLPPGGYDTTFGTNSQMPYLATELIKQGELVSNYYAVTGSEVANKIALISGQGPNPDTIAGCSSYSDITPGTESTDTQQKGQLLGTGCLFGHSTLTLGDELVANGATWKAYVEDPPADAPTGPCGRTPDTPFASFHSVTDLPNCAQSFADMDQLTTDLSTATSTPSLAWIEPHLADLASTDAFLKDLLPRITDSPAYKDGGLIAITFANAPQDGPNADTSACCTEPTYPNMPPAPPADPTAPVKPLPPGADALTGGGGHVGLLLVSSFVKAGTVNAVSSYNHYSLLRSIEDLFELQPTGYAGYPGVLAFDNVIYNAP